MGIRRAQQGDVSAICTIDHIAQVEEERRQFIRRSVRDGTTFVALSDGQVVGYSVLEYSFFSRGFISMLMVRPDCRVERSANRILSFTSNMRQAGLEPRTTLLDARMVKGGYSSEVNGRRYTMEGPVYKIHRLRFGGDTPMLLETRYINPVLCPGMKVQSAPQCL